MLSVVGVATTAALLLRRWATSHHILSSPSSWSGPGSRSGERVAHRCVGWTRSTSSGRRAIQALVTVLLLHPAIETQAQFLSRCAEFGRHPLLGTGFHLWGRSMLNFHGVEGAKGSLDAALFHPPRLLGVL